VAGIAARRAPDGRLVNDNDFVQRFKSAQQPVFAGLLLGAVKLAEQGPPQNVIHQRALARTADARHHRERAQRNARVDVFQIVFRRAQDFQPAAPAKV
jgi:hypothetical protein